MVRRRRLGAAFLGRLEAGVFIVAIVQFFQQLDNVYNMIGSAAGYARETALGITLESRIASGWALVRAVGRGADTALCLALRERGFAVTAIEGQGREGNVLICFLVCARRRSREVLSVVDEMSPDAFVTLEPITHATGGHLPLAAYPASVRE